jgi:hypothetical protein
MFGLRFEKFPTEEHNGHVLLGFYCSQLHCGGIRVYLKGLCEVWICQYHLFGDGRLNIVKCLLMDRISPPWHILSAIILGGFSLPTLSH